jgi:molybdopterin molybdotransferase
MKPGLLSFDEALTQILAQARPPLPIEELDTFEVFDRVLAHDLRAALNVPPMDNTQMDGYAVRRADLQAGVALPVSQRLPAGQVGAALEPGTTARVFTGAMIPAGADAVVMQELTELRGDAVLFKHQPEDGEWIRRIGEDIRAGMVILPAGTRLSPQAAGLAASVGLATVPVRARVRVACFSTGDELAMPGEPLKPGAIYNSNRFVLLSLLRKLGCIVTDLGIVPDSLAATRAALRQAAASNDLIITCGGMSVGEEDHVKPAVQAEGSLSLWSIAMKPGKPLAHGTVRRDAAANHSNSANHASSSSVATAHFIGLPGNPVSAFVTFLMFARPFILRLQGMTEVTPARLSLRADFAWPRPDRRREFLRARINPQGGLDLYPNQGSAVLTSTVWADGLIDNPAGQAIAPGDQVQFIALSELLN